MSRALTSRAFTYRCAVRRAGRDALGGGLRRDIFSASKTFTAVAVGIAEDEGLLDIDDVIVYHPDNVTSAPATGVEAITIRQLLTMSSGITYRWNDPDADHRGDPANDILTTPLGAKPGTAFAYRGAKTYLLSRVIHACSGQDLRDFLLPRLFAPLGINTFWPAHTPSSR